jgi:hypothetical protein
MLELDGVGGSTSRIMASDLDGWSSSFGSDVAILNRNG